MYSLLLVSVLLTAAGNLSSPSCTELRNAFSEYRAAVSQGTEVARYFSHRYLADQVDTLLIDGDEAVILHNVKATRKQILIAPVARSDYQLTARCAASAGSIALTFPSRRMPLYSLATRSALRPQYSPLLGMPCWLPTSLWSQEALRTVANVEHYLDQVPQFLAIGKRG